MGSSSRDWKRKNSSNRKRIRWLRIKVLLVSLEEGGIREWEKTKEN